MLPAAAAEPLKKRPRRQGLSFLVVEVNRDARSDHCGIAGGAAAALDSEWATGTECRLKTRADGLERQYSLPALCTVFHWLDAEAQHGKPLTTARIEATRRIISGTGWH